MKFFDTISVNVLTFILILVLLFCLNYYSVIFLSSNINMCMVYQFIYFYLDNPTLFITWVFHSTSFYFLVMILLSCFYVVVKKIL